MAISYVSLILALLDEEHWLLERSATYYGT
jgi:hypothetical protein